MNGAHRFASSISQAAYLEEGERPTGLLGRIESFCRYDPSGLLAAKRTLAIAALESERYIF
jgi:hypothetical protein